MTYTWDVQRDHAELLGDVLEVIAPRGVVWFSTNRRRFQLQLAASISGLDEISSLEIEDRTCATIPPDFRDPKVHHAFRLSRRG